MDYRKIIGLLKYNSKKIIIISIASIIIFAINVDYWGSEELDKPFNKWYYNTYYYVNVYHESMELFERVPAYISVSNGIFSRSIIVKSIYLDSVNFNFDFSDGERDEDLIIGKPIPFYFSEDHETDYNIYIELTLSKVPIEKYKDGSTAIEPGKIHKNNSGEGVIKRDIRPHRILK